MKTTYDIISVNFKYLPYSTVSLIRCKVDNQFFLEYLFGSNGCVWQHGMIHSWEKSGTVPDLTVLSEEELFQYSLVQEFSETEKMLAVQKYVLQNLESLKKSKELVFMDLIY